MKIVESKRQGGDQLKIRPIHSNIQHFRKQILQNKCKVYQRLLAHARYVPSVLMNISVLEKGIHNAASVATTKLQ